MTGDEIELPPRPKGNWLGVVVERAEVAGCDAFPVTVNEGQGRLPRRRWFPDHRLALLHAADQADALNLPLFDRTSAE